MKNTLSNRRNSVHSGKNRAGNRSNTISKRKKRKNTFSNMRNSVHSREKTMSQKEP
jgi:hypothetical protein